MLSLLGIFLRSIGTAAQTNFTFEDTLTQIGLGYPFLFLLGVSVRARAVDGAGAASSVGYWLAWALYPLPGPDFDYQAVGVPAGLAASLQRARRALEQEQQPRPGRSTSGS